MASHVPTRRTASSLRNDLFDIPENRAIAQSPSANQISEKEDLMLTEDDLLRIREVVRINLGHQSSNVNTQNTERAEISGLMRDTPPPSRYGKSTSGTLVPHDII